MKNLINCYLKAKESNELLGCGLLGGLSKEKCAFLCSKFDETMNYIISNDISDDWSLIYLPCVRIAFDYKVRSLVCKHIDDEIFYVNNLIDYLRENYQETYDSYVGRATSRNLSSNG